MDKQVDNKLATRPNGQTALATPMASFGSESIDGFSSADLDIPLLKLVHGVSKMEGAAKHGGEWWTSLMGFRETVDIVILHEGFARSFFRKGTRRAECMSSDGVNGSRYGKCSACEFNPAFNPEATTEGYEWCHKGRRLLLYIPDDDSYAAMYAMKGNWAAMRKLHTEMAMKRKLREPYQALVTFGVMERRQEERLWFNVAPAIKRIFEGEELTQYRLMAEAARSITYRVVDEEEEQAATDGAPPSDSYDDAPSADAGQSDDSWMRKAPAAVPGGAR